jgi:hypothetical protein
MNSKTKNAIMIFFLILFCNSIFASGVDFDRLNNSDTLYFADSQPQEQKAIFDRGNGCATVELPESSVNALWKEILTKGFSADEITSDQAANNNRQTLDQNNILLTDPNAKAGDLAIKQEIPSKLMNPLETPTILGQSCYGPYEMGLNLKDTLRVGRCTGKDNDSQCYLTDVGQYRKNDMTGFFKEVGVVGKDAIQAIKETINIDSNKDENKSYTENLGAFSDITNTELNTYLSTMESNDQNAIDTELWTATKDKAVKNTTITNNFSVSMQTTCRGENCYINTYTLFDKMFNQYFSVDMVYSATSPFIYNGMARIANHPSIKKTLTKPYDYLKKKGIIKEGGFVDTLTKDPALFVQDPFGRIKKSLDAGRFAKSDVDKFITQKMEPLSNLTKRDIQNYNIQEFTTDLLGNTQKGMGETSGFALKSIVNDSYKLSKAQRRAATDVAQIFGDRVYSANALLKSKMITPDFLAAKNTIDKVVADGLPITEAYKKLTKAQLDAYTDAAYTASRLADSYDIATFKTFKWKSGYEDSSVVSARTYGDFDNLNVYKSTDGHTTGKLIQENKPFGEDFDAFRYKKTATGYDIKGSGGLQTQNVTVTLADGTPISAKRIRTVVQGPDSSNVVKKVKLSDVQNYVDKYPNGYIRYFDVSDKTFKEIRSIDWDPAKYTGVATDIDFYPKTTTQFVDDYIDKATGKKISDIYGKGYYDLDPLETMKQVMDNVPTKFDNTAKSFNEIFTTMSNKEWVSGRGRDTLNQFMRTYNGAAYQRLLTQNPMAFGINFAYWEFKTGGATLFGDTFGLTKYSMYQLPESYSAFHIKHGATQKIYEDAYVDFFANEGSDQGDLFMQFLNSGVNWSNYLAKEITGTITADWAQSLNNVLKKVTEGQIRRSKTDDIVLVTNNLDNACIDQCNYVVGAEYINQETRNASMLMEVGMIEPEKTDAEKEVENTPELPTIVTEETPIETIKEETTEDGTSKETETAKEETTVPETKKTENYQPSISLNQITITTSTPPSINTLNYILENTSEENYKKQGQTIITFSHHTDYDGTFSNQTSDKAIDLLAARENEETCSQKIESLTLAGMSIGKAVPKSMRNHRFAGALVTQQHLAYLVFPASGYFSSFLAPALASDVPQMFLIMPELHNCVDDEEGTYAHFFVSSVESERVTKDSKNKVGEAVKDGVTKVEEAVSKVTEGTELEKGVKFGAEQIKDFAEQKLKENPIVQATYRTSGQTDSTIIGQMFFFEMGPRTKCNAIGYNDKGVENLVDKDTNITLTIDKEKGEMTVVDANGNLKTIIGQENKDFVRIIGTNLAIPAKVVPRSLSYIPVPNNTEPLFEIDTFGNLSVKNADFFDCLRAGYEAQTGLTIPSNAANLTEYLGAVKLGNTIHPATNYMLKPQGTQIMAEGIPRYITNGSNAKAVILGNRMTSISPVDTREITIGQNVALQFERGQLVYVEERKAYIMWVETTTATHGNDIEKLKTELIKEKATNGCDDTEEIGLKFNVSPEKDNDQAKANTDKLNKAFEKVGPFKMFDTETKTFIFYVSDPPECEQRLKIIDKVTGEVTDTKITSVQQTPNGLIVKTDDGKTHEFGFSAEEGVPKVTYNGEKETLLSAQGKNGSFWYDPETGNWYTTNGNLIPFNDQFKDGVTFAVNPNGQVTGNPGNNVFNIGSGSGGASGNGLNVPLTPENKILFVMYISIILIGFMLIYSKKK